MVSCDVLVVGGGPAGAAAARQAAQNGLSVICIDMREHIGIPVKCAEGIGSYLFEFLPFKIPDYLLDWKIDGMLFWADNLLIQRTSGYWGGYTLDRKNFDPWLITLAKNAGAKIYENSLLSELIFDENHLVTSAVIISNGKKIIINPKIVVAADGSESKVQDLISSFSPVDTTYGWVYSWELSGLNLSYPHFETILMGEFAPDGYAFLFPKSLTTANFGVGSLSLSSLKDNFRMFLDSPPIEKQVKTAEFVVEKTKKEIWSKTPNKLVYSNIIFAGDSANHNLKPFVEGILPAIISGTYAANIASNVINKSKRLVDIDYSYFDPLPNIFNQSEQMRNAVEKIFSLQSNTKHLLFAGLASDIFSLKSIDYWINASYADIKAELKISPLNSLR